MSLLRRPAAGSPRISYCGYQIGLAFYKCVLQSYGTYTELRVVRDRLIGIALGLAVFGWINTQLWPVSALETTAAKLSSILRLLAKLAGLPEENEDLASQLTEAYGLRLQVYQAIGTIRELFESAKFEPGASRREHLVEIGNTAEILFFYILAIIQHRLDLRPLAVPGRLVTASARFRATLAGVLLHVSSRLEDKTERPIPDLQSALADLEQTFTTEIGTVTDPDIAIQIRARLTLYREVVPIAMKLARATPWCVSI